MLELNKLYNMDCMEGMKQFPDKYFELAIVDPPYGIGAGKEKPHNGWKDYGIKHWDNQSPDKAYFEELFRVSQNQIIWGANHFISKISRDFSCFIIWDKGQRDFSLADGEMAWTSFKKAARFFNYSRARALQEGKIHPTQKPIALYKWLLKNYAKEGDKILDTHVGSASSLIACYQMNFDYIGFEIDKEYFEKAQKRIADEMAQISLFY
jgi:site-specific DNA-methyltransferase (adenine-specific)